MTKAASDKSETLREVAYGEIRAAVLHGAFEPGDAITIRELAERLKLGVTPVREGVQLLASHGAIEFMPNRSVRVPVLGADDLAAMFDTRILVESHAARLAANNLRPRDFTTLERLAGELQVAIKKLDPERGLRANFDFHFLIYRGARSPYLLEAIERLWLRVGPLHVAPYRASPAERAEYASTEADHRKLIAALKAGNVARIDAIMRDLLAHSRDWYIRYCVGADSIFAPLRPGTGRAVKKTIVRRR